MRRCRSIGFVLFCLLSLPAAAGVSFIEAAPTPLLTTNDDAGVLALAAADFNGDGKPDLAVIYTDGFGAATQSFVAVMLGNGDGTFQAPTKIYTSTSQNLFPGAILAKDFDGDGEIDLVVSVLTVSSYQILWFKGRGDGTFDAPIATNTGQLPARSLQSADLNHDGIPDLVASDGFFVSVLLGVGDGTFTAQGFYSVGGAVDVAIGDVDGINGPDIVVANYGAATIGVLLNNGDGTFGSVTSFSANMKPKGLYLADFDGDGKLDVVAAGDNCNGGNVDSHGCMVFMKGAGNGSFAVPTDANFTGLDSIPIRLTLVENVAPDLNGDGRADVVFVIQPTFGMPWKSQVMVGLSNGDGTFSISYWVGALPQANGLPDVVIGIATVPGDFDQDGVIDLAFGTHGFDFTRGYVSILFGDTPGTFETPRSYPANYKGFAGGLWPSGVLGVLGDFTGSGKTDLVVLDTFTDSVVVSPMLNTFRGNGDGSFQDAITALQWRPGQTGHNSTLRAADLDKNGTLDVVFLGPQSGIVASGNGDGTFTNFSSFGYAAGAPTNMVIADFDGDGYPDVAIFEDEGCVSGTATKSIEVLLQGTGGTKAFASKSVRQVVGTCPRGPSGWGMVAADFDEDGKIDLVVSRVNNAGGSDILFLRGNGDGTFAKPRIVAMLAGNLSGIADFAAADLRKSGNLDLIGVGDTFVYVQLGNGNGSFQAPVSYLATGFCGNSCGVKIADFDGDGIPDIAIAEANAFGPGAIYPGGFAVLRGKGDGTFEPVRIFAIGSTGGGWLDVADLNGDGLPDVVVGHSGINGNGYTVLINDSPPPPTADLAISESDSPDPVNSIGPLTYTITVTNNGPDAATGVTMTDPLPATVILVSATPSQGSCSGTTTVICTLGTLSKGAASTVTIVVTPTAIGGISNTASVTANELDPDPSNNSATQVTTINAAARYLTALSPAKMWVGQNGSARKLKYDLLAELLVNGSVVGTGQISGVKAGSSSFSKTILDSITLGLPAPTTVPPGASFSLRLSVRISCAAASHGISALARLWYNGQPIDSGTSEDAGSRFDATIGGTNSNYYLRPAFVLDTVAGSAKQFIDVAVDDTAPCPARAFTQFGAWTISLP